jgi:hypothetical protein
MSEGAASENVAVITSTGPNTNAAFTTDGNTWTTFSAPFSSLTKLIYGNLFLALQSNSTTYYTSTDGPTWTSRTFPVAIRTITWDGNIYLAVPTTASSTWYQSTDGINWTTRNMSAFANATSYNYGNIEFLDGFYVVYFSNIAFYTASLAVNWIGAVSIPSGQTPFCGIRWFGNLVFMDGSPNTKPPYSWLIPPATSATSATAIAGQVCGAAIDALGRLVTLERTASNLGTFRVSSAGLLPALFTIATTDAEVAN